MRTRCLELVPFVLLALGLVAGGLLAGCGGDTAMNPAGDTSLSSATLLPPGGVLGDPSARPVEEQGLVPPAGLVSVSFGPESLDLWPWTGSSFDGTPVDPVNLIFVGAADPVRIRAALMALDGDRTAFGYPDAYPFNAQWSDAIGSVQSNYAEGEGWTGSAIQLQLGGYDPIRFHLRIFRTNRLFGQEGVWTVAAAHMDLLIPGTADHEVLSWKRAREIVVADMLRTGLLDGAVPVYPVGPITSTPSYRSIQAPVYNGLPPYLVAFIEGPPQPVAADVPLPNDGMAFILNVATPAPIVAGTFPETRTMMYDIVAPKPFCSGAMPEYVHIGGPVDFTQEVTVTAGGDYTVRSTYYGALNIVPLDISVWPPVPGGMPYAAEVEGSQHVDLKADGCIVDARDRRIAPQTGGTEMLSTHLRTNSRGSNTFKLLLHCLDEPM